MKVNVPPGKYILAVSGGVDSVVLLDLLSNLPGVGLVVAHFNHGIRPDSGEDERLVAAAARKYGLPFETGYGRLGAGASEDAARQARYEFLNEVKTRHGAQAVITAHHQDDLIETALINLLRGTGRRGLTAIADNKDVLRPLLNHSKKEILNYAKKNKLRWREDPTNDSLDYLRNYVRYNLVPKMTAAQRQDLLATLDKALKSGQQMDSEISELSPKILDNQVINRGKFSSLPVELGNELLMYWLRCEGLMDFDKKTINRLNVALRAAKSQSVHPVRHDLVLKVNRQTAGFERRPLR